MKYWVQFGVEPIDTSKFETVYDSYMGLNEV